MRIEDVVDLNEQNVKKFLKYIKARPDDAQNRLGYAYAYIDENNAYDKRTLIRYSVDRYLEQKDRIISMLGQLKKVHDLEKSFSRENCILDFIDLQTKYDGTRWTEDPNTTLFLYWLGSAGGYFQGLIKKKDGIYRTDLRESALKIPAMESPNDPNLLNRFPKS